MTGHASHIIHRRVIDIEVGEQSLADEVLDHIGQEWASVFDKADDIYFDELSTNGDTIFVDRLEVSLGSVDPDCLSGDLIDRYTSALADKIQAATQEFDVSFSQNENMLPPGPELAALMFLESGLLPWWWQPDARQDDANDAAQNPMAPLVNAFEALCQSRPALVTRWLRQLHNKRDVEIRCQVQFSEEAYSVLQRAIHVPTIPIQTEANRPNPASDGRARSSQGAAKMPNADKIRGQTVPGTLDENKPLDAESDRLETSRIQKASDHSCNKNERPKRRGKQQSLAPEELSIPDNLTRPNDNKKAGSTIPDSRKGESINAIADDRARTLDKKAEAEIIQEPSAFNESVLERSIQVAIQAIEPLQYSTLKKNGKSTGGGPVEALDERSGTDATDPNPSLPSVDRNTLTAPDEDAGAVQHDPKAGGWKGTPPLLSDQARQGTAQQYATAPPVVSTGNTIRLFEQQDLVGPAEIVVQNGGIVLLWPFLAVMFREAGYLGNEGWYTPEMTVRAVHLLHYAATGEMGGLEYELALNKILCGLEIYVPLPRSVKLTPREQSHADEMLVAVLNHWAQMRGTSPTGLRSSFLMRSGFLVEEDERWLLRLEAGPYDMLLDSLPWSYRTISLSWMQKILEVEW